MNAMNSWNEIRKAATAMASMLILLCALATHGACIAPWNTDVAAGLAIALHGGDEINCKEK